jgi:hypothetical protein
MKGVQIGRVSVGAARRGQVQLWGAEPARARPAASCLTANSAPPLLSAAATAAAYFRSPTRPVDPARQVSEVSVEPTRVAVKAEVFDSRNVVPRGSRFDINMLGLVPEAFLDITTPGEGGCGGGFLLPGGGAGACASTSTRWASCPRPSSTSPRPVRAVVGEVFFVWEGGAGAGAPAATCWASCRRRSLTSPPPVSALPRALARRQGPCRPYRSSLRAPLSAPCTHLALPNPPTAPQRCATSSAPRGPTRRRATSRAASCATTRSSRAARCGMQRGRPAPLALGTPVPHACAGPAPLHPRSRLPTPSPPPPHPHPHLNHHPQGSSMDFLMKMYLRNLGDRVRPVGGDSGGGGEGE